MDSALGVGGVKMAKVWVELMKLTNMLVIFSQWVLGVLCGCNVVRKVEVREKPIRSPVKWSGEHEVGMGVPPGILEEKFKGISDSEIGVGEINGELEIASSMGEGENGA